MKNLKLKSLLKEFESSKDYKKRCEQGSIEVAQAFKKLLGTKWSDKDYNKYQNVIKKVGIPTHSREEIESIVQKSKGNYRFIDIYQYW